MKKVLRIERTKFARLLLLVEWYNGDVSNSGYHQFGPSEDGACAGAVAAPDPALLH